MYRKRFCAQVKRVGDSKSDFMEYLSINFIYWIQSVDDVDDVNKLTEVMIIEQIVECVRDNLQTFLIKQNPHIIKDAAKKADE